MAAASISRATLAVMVIIGLIVVQSQVGLAQGQGGGQSCSADLGNLNLCAPYVVPGATNTSPSQDCCAALQGVDQGCICSTLRVVAQLPSLCNLPALTCTAN
ncbi:hypothetical protein LguiB_029126 [Lonicera macranthoides]